MQPNQFVLCSMQSGALGLQDYSQDCRLQVQEVGAVCSLKLQLESQGP